MKNILAVLSLFSFLLTACSKDENSNPVKTPPVPIQLDSFPLAIGNTWLYYTETRLEDYNGQVINSGYYNNLWKVIADTLINGAIAIKIQQIDSNYNGSVHIGYTYYRNQSDGFYGVGVDNLGSMFELKGTDPFPGSLSGLTPSPDTIFEPQTPIQFLKFPSAISDYWHSIVHLGSDTVFTRKIYTNFQTVSSSGVTFDCIRLQSNRILNGVLDNNYTVYQDFGYKGLIAETVIADSLLLGNSYARFVRTTKLIQINF